MAILRAGIGIQAPIIFDMMFSLFSIPWAGMRPEVYQTVVRTYLARYAGWFHPEFPQSERMEMGLTYE